MKKTLLALLVVGFACSPEKKPDTKKESTASIKIKYATGFKVSSIGNATLLEVPYPFQGATIGYKYLLVPKDQEVPSVSGEVKIIRTPISSIVCTSTTHIPLLDYLNVSETLSGFPTMDYVSSSKMRKRIDAGLVTELGIDKGMNLEKLAALHPDIVMGYTLTSDYGHFKKIEEMNIPVIINAEYLEQHPLGRAEWIKFVAQFYDRGALADSIFNSIEERYLEIKSLTDSLENRPTVLSGIVYGDAWFMPGGQNYAAKILNDGGCEYLWSDDTSHGFLQKTFESVFEKARGADLWIGVGLFQTLEELKASDHRYSNFDAFKEGTVYSSDARRGAKGGSEALELGYLRPDLMLADIVKIAHPELLPEHELYFHKQLK